MRLFLSFFFHIVLVKFFHEFVQSNNLLFLIAEYVAVFLLHLVTSLLPVDVCVLWLLVLPHSVVSLCVPGECAPRLSCLAYIMSAVGSV